MRTIRFVEGDGDAAWSRSTRTATVHSGYLQRFVAQAKAAGLGEVEPSNGSR